MLTQLSTLKARLGIDEFEVKDDVLLSNAIQAVTDRFDKECGRTLARTVDALEEFSADETELRVACYPIETVSRFDLKGNEIEGWVIQVGIKFLVRRRCVISLATRLGSWCEQGRVTYTGGYVLPGTPADPGQLELPKDLEQAAVEQVSYWYQNRDHLGVIREWPKGGTYQQFVDLDLLPSVRSVLRKYERWNG
jgi:hypothetical protein